MLLLPFFILTSSGLIPYIRPVSETVAVVAPLFLFIPLRSLLLVVMAPSFLFLPLRLFWGVWLRPPWVLLLLVGVLPVFHSLLVMLSLWSVLGIRGPCDRFGLGAWLLSWWVWLRTPLVLLLLVWAVLLLLLVAAVTLLPVPAPVDGCSSVVAFPREGLLVRPL